MLDENRLLTVEDNLQQAFVDCSSVEATTFVLAVDRFVALQMKVDNSKYRKMAHLDIDYVVEWIDRAEMMSSLLFHDVWYKCLI